MSDYDYLQPKAREYLSKSDEERITLIRNFRWIGYSKAIEILDELDELVSFPRVDRMPGMLIIGESNNGKTQLVRRFLSKYPPQENLESESTLSRVVFCEAPSTPNEGEFYGEVLRGLYKAVPSGSKEARKHRVFDVLSEMKTKVLVIDELHNILAGTSTKQQQFLNMIKNISNKLKISIVGCGTEDLMRAVRVDSQLENRLIPSTLPKWQNNIEFKTLLSTFESLIPLKKPSNLSSRELSEKVCFQSEGLIGEVSTLLNKAATYAIRNEVEQITLDVIEKCSYKPPSTRSKDLNRVF